MFRTRSLIHAVWILGLGLGFCFSLGGCGSGSTDTGPPVMTDAQKAEQAARFKETADAYKDFQKTKKSSPKKSNSRTS